MHIYLNEQELANHENDCIKAPAKTELRLALGEITNKMTLTPKKHTIEKHEEEKTSKKKYS